MVSEASQVCCWAHCLFPCHWLQKPGHNNLMGLLNLGRFLIFWRTKYAYTWEKRVKPTVAWGYIKVGSSTSFTPRTSKYLCSKVTKLDNIYLLSLFFLVNCVPGWFQAIFAAYFSKIFTISLVVSDDWAGFSNKIFLLVWFIVTHWNVFAHKKPKEMVCIWQKCLCLWDGTYEKGSFS